MPVRKRGRNDPLGNAPPSTVFQQLGVKRQYHPPELKNSPSTPRSNIYESLRFIGLNARSAGDLTDRLWGGSAKNPIGFLDFVPGVQAVKAAYHTGQDIHSYNVGGEHSASLLDITLNALAVIPGGVGTKNIAKVGGKFRYRKDAPERGMVSVQRLLYEPNKQHIAQAPKWSTARVKQLLKGKYEREYIQEGSKVYYGIVDEYDNTLVMTVEGTIERGVGGKLGYHVDVRSATGQATPPREIEGKSLRAIRLWHKQNSPSEELGTLLDSGHITAQQYHDLGALQLPGEDRGLISQLRERGVEGVGNIVRTGVPRSVGKRDTIILNAMKAIAKDPPMKGVEIVTGTRVSGAHSRIAEVAREKGSSETQVIPLEKLGKRHPVGIITEEGGKPIDASWYGEGGSYIPSSNYGLAARDFLYSIRNTEVGRAVEEFSQDVRPLLSGESIKTALARRSTEKALARELREQTGIPVADEGTARPMGLRQREQRELDRLSPEERYWHEREELQETGPDPWEGVRDDPRIVNLGGLHTPTSMAESLDLTDIDRGYWRGAAFSEHTPSSGSESLRGHLEAFAATRSDFLEGVNTSVNIREATRQRRLVGDSIFEGMLDHYLVEEVGYQERRASEGASGRRAMSWPEIRTAIESELNHIEHAAMSNNFDVGPAFTVRVNAIRRSIQYQEDMVRGGFIPSARMTDEQMHGLRSSRSNWINELHRSPTMGQESRAFSSEETELAAEAPELFRRVVQRSERLARVNDLVPSRMSIRDE